MIESLIEKEKAKLKDELANLENEYNSLNEKLSEFNIKLDELTKETDNIEIKELPVKIQYNIFERVFLNKFRKDYDQVKKENDAKYARSEEIYNQTEKIKAERVLLKKQITEFDLDKKKKDYEIDVDIEYLVNKYPEYAEDYNFMDEAIKISPANIAFDKTNNFNLYKYIIGLLINNISPQYFYNVFGDPENVYKEFLKYYYKAMQEMDNPSKVADGKYKIPTKYLLESIRMAFDKRSLSQSDNYTEEKLLSHYIMTTIDKFSNYFKFDGIISQEFGSKMSELWDNPNILTGVHGVDRNVGTMISFAESSIDGILKDGLMGTNAQGELNESNRNPMLLATAYVKDYSDLDFISLINYSYSNTYGYVVLQIPKEGMGLNATIPIWGIDENTSDRVGKVFLKNKYVVGYVVNNRNINPEDYKFVENNNSEKLYQYSLMDYSFSAYGDVIKTEENRNIAM